MDPDVWYVVNFAYQRYSARLPHPTADTAALGGSPSDHLHYVANVERYHPCTDSAFFYILWCISDPCVNLSEFGLKQAPELVEHLLAFECQDLRPRHFHACGPAAFHGRGPGARRMGKATLIIHAMRPVPAVLGLHLGHVAGHAVKVRGQKFAVVHTDFGQNYTRIFFSSGQILTRVKIGQILTRFKI